MGLMTIFVQGRCDFVDCQWRARGVDETGLLSKCKQALEGEGFFWQWGLKPRSNNKEEPPETDIKFV